MYFMCVCWFVLICIQINVVTYKASVKVMLIMLGQQVGIDY